MFLIDFSDNQLNAFELDILTREEIVEDIISKYKKAVDNHINPNNLILTDRDDITDADCRRIKIEVEKYIRSKGRYYVLY